MVSQVKGLAEAVGWPYALHTVLLRQPWKSMLTGCIPIAPWIFQTSELLEGQAPRLLITCGRQAVMSALYLKKKHGPRVFTVHIQNPKIDPRRFDLVVSPQHDGLSGPNVFESMGALHHITADALADAREQGVAGRFALPATPFVTVLLGGPNRYYRFSESDMRRFEQKLQRLERSGVRLAILPSRRTPASVVGRFQSRFSSNHLVWSGSGENPYLSALALGTHVVVTSDSTSMISEAAGTGKPVYVEYLSERRYARRFRNFHESFERAEITRPFEGTTSEWTYDAPHATVAVGQLIRNQLGISHVTPACA